MARAPRAPVGGENRARSALVSPVPSGGPRRSPLRDVAAFLGDLDEVVRQNAADRDRVEATRALGEFDRVVDERVADLDPLAADFDDRVRGAADAARSEVLTGTELRTPGVSAALENQLEAALQSKLAEAAARRRTQVRERAADLFARSRDATLGRIRSDPDGFDLYVEQFVAESDGAAEALDPNTRRDLEREFEELALVARAEGLALQGRHDEAREFIDQRVGLQDPATARTARRLVREIENRQRNDHLSATARRVADLELAVARADSEQELAAAEAEVRRADRQGLFRGREGVRADLLRRVAAGEEGFRDEARAQEIADLAIQAEEARTVEGVEDVRRAFEAAEKRGAFEGRAGSRAKIDRALVKKRRRIEEGKVADKIDREIQDLAIDVIDARSPEALADLRRRVEALPEEAPRSAVVSLIGQIEAKREEVREERRKDAAALSKLNSGLGVDDREEADRAFRHFAADVDPQEPGALEEAVASFAARAGMLPSRAAQVVENAGRTENPQLLADATRLYDRVRREAPGVDQGEGDRVRLTSATAELLGLTYEDAAERVLSGVPDKVTLELRRERLKEGLGDDFDPREEVAELFDPLLGFPPAVPERVARDYERTLSLHHDLSGDLELAREATERRFRRDYGATEVGGARRVTMHPPEVRFPGTSNANLSTEQKASILAADATRELAFLGVEPAEAEGSDLPPVALVGDRQTERDIAAGRRPSYEVRVRDQFGALVPVRAEKADGTTELLRYRLPTTEELADLPEFREIADEALEDARRSREGRREAGEPGGRRGAARRAEERGRAERRELLRETRELLRETAPERRVQQPGGTSPRGATGR